MSPSVSVRLLLTQSDARLVALASDGHERAFEALVQRYRRPLLRYCRRLLLPDERAEDALQQALMQAWLALQRGVEVLDARSWLYRIVHNAALNMLRVSGYDYCTLSESLSGADAPQADLDRRIAVREALAGLAALPSMQREALLRTAVEGASHAQAARDLGVSETALRGLVYRARCALRTAATAITPPPLLGWALTTGARTAPLAQRLAGAGAGSSSAGLAGLALKGGAVVVTAGTLATGIVGHARRPALTRPHDHATEVSNAAPATLSAPSISTTVTDAAYASQPLHSHPQPTTGHDRSRGPKMLVIATPPHDPAEPSPAFSVTAPHHDFRAPEHHDGAGAHPGEDQTGQAHHSGDPSESSGDRTTGSNNSSSLGSSSGNPTQKEADGSGDTGTQTGGGSSDPSGSGGSAGSGTPSGSDSSGGSDGSGGSSGSGGIDQKDALSGEVDRQSSPLTTEPEPPGAGTPAAK